MFEELSERVNVLVCELPFGKCLVQEVVDDFFLVTVAQKGARWACQQSVVLGIGCAAWLACLSRGVAGCTRRRIQLLCVVPDRIHQILQLVSLRLVLCELVGGLLLVLHIKQRIKHRLDRIHRSPLFSDGPKVIRPRPFRLPLNKSCPWHYSLRARTFFRRN